VRRPLVLLSSLIVAAALVRLAPACLEITPIIVEKEASSVGADAGCVRCLETPGNCLDLIDSCKTDTRCLPVYECMSREQCLDLPTLGDKITCGLPCAADAGVTRLDDPLVKDYLIALVGCGRDKCAEPCNLGDASLGL
jgi:hypothetical protein